jgi:STE24 endopeptidase
MSFRRLAILLCFLFMLPVATRAAETPAEHIANAYAAHELASHPRHNNIPDYTLSPTDLAKSQHLAKIGIDLHFADEIWGIVSVLLLLSLGIIAWMRDTAVRLSANHWAQGFTFFLLYLIAATLLELPITLYGHHLSRVYGFSIQSWPSWIADQAKAFALTWIIGGLILMLLFWIIRKLPRTWWFAFWVCTIPIILAGMFAAPYVEPIFNHYEPLQKTNPALVAKLEQVVQRGHMDIPPQRMFLMKASAKVTTLNADVEGFGASKRVVVWDTTISKMTPDEILFVFGHESGHYVLHHIRATLVFVMALLFVTLFLGYLFVQWTITRFGPRWRIPSQNDWGTLAILILAASIIGLLTEPIQSSYSRMHEHAADVYGQEAIHGLVPNPQLTAQQAFDVLGQVGYADPNPNPFYEFWTYDHPSIGRRAAFAHAYNPWAPGMEPKYFKKQ